MEIAEMIIDYEKEYIEFVFPDGSRMKSIDTEVNSDWDVGQITVKNASPEKIKDWSRLLTVKPTSAPQKESEMEKNLIIDTSGFTKEFSCDRCGAVLACSPDVDPPGCMNCNPELWGSIDGKKGSEG